MSFSGLIGKLFGRGSEPSADGLQDAADRMQQAIAKLPQPDLSNAPPEVVAVRTWLARPDWPDRVLAERVISYLLTGQPADVLDDLATGRGRVWNYLSADLNYRSPEDTAAILARRDFTFHAVRHDEAMAIRLARVNATHHRSYVRDDAPEVPNWLSEFVARGWHDELRGEPIAMATMERIVAEAGLSTVILFQFIYTRLPLNSWPVRSRHQDVSGIDGFLARHEAELCEHTRHLLDVRSDGFQAGFTSLMTDLADFGLVRGGYLQLAFEVAATGPKAAERVARQALGAANRTELQNMLTNKLASGSATEKKTSAGLLADLADADARLALSPPVDAPPGSRVIDAVDGPPIVIRPVAPISEAAPLTAEQQALLAAAVARYNAAVEAYAATPAQEKQPKGAIAPAEVEHFLAWITTGELQSSEQDIWRIRRIGSMLLDRYNSLPGYDDKELKAFLASDFTFAQAARLSGCDERLHYDCGQSWITAFAEDDGKFLSPLLRRLKAGDDFRAALRLIEPLRVSPQKLVINLLINNRWADTVLPDPLPESIFHLMLDHLDLFEQALGTKKVTTERLEPELAFSIIARWPKIPASIALALVDFGLTGHKLLRKQARAALASAAGIDRMLVARLVDDEKEVRAAAAEWIGERRIASAEAALRKALAKEKMEGARAAIVTALARIGADISDQFGDARLRAEAEKGLAKASLAPLAWFPFAAVPPLHWQDGAAVPGEVVKWWIVLAEKLKDPAGNALFDLYLDRLRPADAAAFGLFLLQTFIARDTQSPSDVEARQRAEAETDRVIRRWPPFGAPPDRNALIEEHIRKIMGQQVGCSENRGFLGLAVRAPGGDAAELVRRYLKDNGHKVNPCKALLTALARNPAPAAIQAVLAAGKRLKQKSVEALARELIAQVAEERGWTAEELADHTIPTAGFDEAGELGLDCGAGRVFTAVYRGSKIELLNPDRKPVKALPAARNEQDEPLVEAAKKALSTAKKEIKQVETIQRARLYDAMCVERTWKPEIWTANLKAHPIAGKLCQRLVWLALAADGAVMSSFRLLDDGSLTDFADAAVSIESAAAIKLAHAALLTPEQSERWVAHLGDYEIVPLFGQFGHPDHGIKPAANSLQVSDREGWMIDNQTLAKAVEKLGYERGELVDAGGFSEYFKRFEGAGVRAVLNFSGSGAAVSEKHACAIKSMSYERMRPGSPHRGAPIKLRDLPKVLLAETINDLVTIAAAGTGVDQDWKKKTGW